MAISLLYSGAAAGHLGGRYYDMASEEWVLREDYQRGQRQRALDGVALAGTGDRPSMSERGLIGGPSSAALAGTGDRPSMSGRAARGAALAGTGDRPSMSERGANGGLSRSVPRANMNPRQLASHDLRDVLSEKLRPAFRRAHSAAMFFPLPM